VRFVVMHFGYGRGVEFVDIYVNRRPLGHAYMQDDRLEGALTLRGRRRTRLADCKRCPHERVVLAFAHRRSRDEHWPIAYCVDCFGIVAGLDPLVRSRRPRWKFDDQNVIVARWTREWPKPGRPRHDAPPAATAWPDAA
jgi:hypothetical protein